MTVAHVYTVTFEGIEAREVDVQVHIAEGGSGEFTIVGLADKAVGESAERVRSALAAGGLAPARFWTPCASRSNRAPP
jgi:magnesium chelatase family protein